MHRQVGDVLLVDADHALVGLDQADDHVEAGGLAGTVRTEQADDLPAIDGHADVADDLPAFIAFGQVLGFERCHYWAFFFGWMTMSMRGRGLVTWEPVARPALTIWRWVS